MASDELLNFWNVASLTVLGIKKPRKGCGRESLNSVDVKEMRSDFLSVLWSTHRPASQVESKAQYYLKLGKVAEESRRGKISNYNNDSDDKFWRMRHVPHTLLSAYCLITSSPLEVASIFSSQPKGILKPRKVPL